MLFNIGSVRVVLAHSAIFRATRIFATINEVISCFAAVYAHTIEPALSETFERAPGIRINTQTHAFAGQFSGSWQQSIIDTGYNQI